MACRRHLSLVLAACLLADAFCVPADLMRRRRGFDDNELDSSSETSVSLGGDASKSPVASEEPTTASTTTTTTALDPFEDDDDDDDDDFSEPMQTAPTTGSNIFSLLRLAGALFPSSSGVTAQRDDISGPAPPAPPSPLWTLKMDILRAILQFGTSVAGMASASSTNAITV